MRRSAVMLSIPAISLATCLLGVLLAPHAWSCGAAAHACAAHGVGRDVLMLSMPVLVLVAYGLGAGARQVHQTRRGLRVLRAKRRPVSLRLQDLAARLELGGRIEVVEATRADAFCYGLLQPRVCLTSAIETVLDDAELEAVLRHERHHLRRYDPQRVVGWTVLRHAWWWLDVNAGHAELRRELAADRAVIAAQGRRPLASVLYKVLTAGHVPTIRDGLAVSGLTVTDARLQHLTGGNTPVVPRWVLVRWLILPALLASTLGLCSALMAIVGRG